MALREFHHPDAEIALGLPGPWTAHCTAPRLRGVPRLDPVAVDCNGVSVPRLPGETEFAMLIRASREHDTTGEPWRLVYALVA